MKVPMKHTFLFLLIALSGCGWLTPKESLPKNQGAISIAAPPPDLAVRMTNANTRMAADKLQRAGVLSKGIDHCRRMTEARFNAGAGPGEAYSAYTDVCLKEFAKAECYAHEKPRGHANTLACTQRRMDNLQQHIQAVASREQQQKAQAAAQQQQQRAKEKNNVWASVKDWVDEVKQEVWD
jgi:hypothetical protein